MDSETCKIAKRSDSEARGPGWEDRKVQDSEPTKDSETRIGKLGGRNWKSRLSKDSKTRIRKLRLDRLDSFGNQNTETRMTQDCDLDFEFRPRRIRRPGVRPGKEYETHVGQQDR